MRILFVINRFYPAIGGAETHVYLLSKYLVKNGHEVTVYTTNSLSSKDITNLSLVPPFIKPGESKKKCFDETIDGFSIKRFDLKFRYWSFNWIPNMFRELKNNINDFDIVHAHGYHISTSLIACYYAKKYGKPFVLTGHDLIIPDNLSPDAKIFKKIYDAIFGKYLLNNTGKLVALTSDHIQQYNERGGDTNKIRIIPNGIELTKYNNVEIHSEFLRNFGIFEEDIILLFVGRIEKYKGIQDVIEIMPSLLKKYPSIKFVVVGKEYGFLGELENLSRRLDLGDKVIFTGNVSEEILVQLYKRANIFILPSKMEGFGIVFLEAMASSTLCMAYPIPAVRKLIQNKKNGILVNDQKELLDNIVYYLRNPKEKSEIERNAMEYVKNYDINYIIKSIESIYSEGINENMLNR